MPFSIYEVGRYMPKRLAMRAALQQYGADVVAAFDDGHYQYLFGGVTHKDAVVNPEDWARGYSKNGEFLEAGALQARREQRWLPNGSNDLAFARARDAANAASRNRRTPAGLATDISEPFEEFLQPYTNRLPARAQFAVTAADVAVLDAAMSRVHRAAVSIESILADVESHEDFLLRVIAHCRHHTKWGVAPDDEDIAYWSAVTDWVGHERGFLFAIELAEADASIEDVRAFAAAGLTPEYALATL